MNTSACRTVVDGSGDVWLAGTFAGTKDFDPGTGITPLTSARRSDICVAKYDASRAYMFGATLDSTGNDRVLGLTLDQQGSVWICGPLTGTVDFDPGPNTTALTSALGGGFITRYTDPTATTDVSRTPAHQASVKIFGEDRSVILDVTTLDAVDAQVRVMSLLGQPVASARHARTGMLRLPLADVAPGCTW